MYNGEVLGRCHICTDTKPISYCNWCHHWFCQQCKGKWWPRGKGFVKEKFLGITYPGCCGVN